MNALQFTAQLRLLENSTNVDDTEKLSVRERCLAACSELMKFKATIIKVIENKSYEILFDDGSFQSFKRTLH